MVKQTNVVNEYTAKTFTVNAVRWHGDNIGEIVKLVGKHTHVCPCVSGPDAIMLADHRGAAMMCKGDWLVIIGDGNVYSVSDEDFCRMF